MSELIIYLLKVSVVFSLLTLVYYLLFRQLTFHSFNRAVLLMIIPLSLILPFVDLDIQPTIYPSFLESQPKEIILSDHTHEVESKSSEAKYNYWWLLELTYYLGLSISLIIIVINTYRLAIQVRSLGKWHSRKYSIIKSEVETVFSSFRWIFIPKNSTPENLGAILKHEIAHVRLFHSYDLLITELFLAISWFNPFGYLFKQLLKSVHEFQADEHVLEGNIKKSEYLSLMLDSIVGKTNLTLTSSFKNSTIKNRIKMMTKNKNSIAHAGKYLLIIPVVFMITLAFSTIDFSKPSIFPIKEGQYFRISSPFGVKRKVPFSEQLKVHGGIDITANSGTPVMATGSGKIIKSEFDDAWGNIVIIDHGDGYETWYAHMNDLAVKEGQIVTTGKVVGHVGNTGNSTAPHLHYEVRKDGERVNPEDYFEQ